MYIVGIFRESIALKHIFLHLCFIALISEASPSKFLEDSFVQVNEGSLDKAFPRKQVLEPRLRGGNIELPQLFPLFSIRVWEKRHEKKILHTIQSGNTEPQRKRLLEPTETDHLNSSKQAFYKSREKSEKQVLSVISADGESDFLPLEQREKDTKDQSEGKDVLREDQLGLSGNQQRAVNSSSIAEEKGEAVVKSEDKHDEVGEILDHILDKLDDEEDKGAGKFNETIENKEGTLEWVARVGKHHHKAPDASEGEKGDSLEIKNGSKHEGKPALPVPEETSPVQEEKSREDDKELSLMDMVLGNKKHEKEAPGKNMTVMNGQVSSSFLSEGEVKEMAEEQAKEKAEKEQKEEQEKSENSGVEDVPRLIDSSNNEYVISKPGKGSKMQLQEDFTLISDIVKVIVSAALGALVCGFTGQPLILGYLVAGMIVGPGGLRLIHELVQVETLAQFGVVFLLFALGIEFNLSKMQGCQAVALGGGAIQIIISMVLGALFSTTITQGIFIGAFLSMSSTAVVLKCLMDANLGNTEHGQIMLGTLILQDCALGLLLAVLPALSSPQASALAILHTLIHALSLLAAFCACAFLLAKLAIPRFLHHLMRLSKYSAELYQLGCVGLCLTVALLSESLGLSLEVGAFVAGLMLSGGKHSEKTLHQIEPIRNMFAALFLASIGMVMNPEFLWKHIFILLSSLAVVFVGKALLIAFTVRLFGYSATTAVSVGIALSQIGEFSFVLLSRAQTLNLVSHKVYLLLMGTTALSLVMTPFTFKLVTWIVTNEEKWKQRGRGGGVLLGSTNGHPPSDPESLVSPHVMTSYRDSDTVRFRMKPLNPHDEERESNEEEKCSLLKLPNGTKTLQGSHSMRSSPRTPSAGKAAPPLPTARSTPEGLGKGEKDGKFSSPHVIMDMNQGGLGGWMNNTPEHTNVIAH